MILSGACGKKLEDLERTKTWGEHINSIQTQNLLGSNLPVKYICKNRCKTCMMAACHPIQLKQFMTLKMEAGPSLVHTSITGSYSSFIQNIWIKTILKLRDLEIFLLMIHLLHLSNFPVKFQSSQR